MTAREYLHQMRTIKYQIKVKKLELRDLREDMETIHSPSYGDRVQGGSRSRFEDQIIKAIRIEEDIRIRTAQKIDRLNDAHRMINSLPDERAAALLTDRYINNRSSDEVAKDINYAAAYVRKLTNDAVEMFIEKFGDDF